MLNVKRRHVAVGYSGGADSAALAYRLDLMGAKVIPVYVSYRGNEGGKTAKDYQAAKISAETLGLSPIARVKDPLGERPKSHRNRFLIEVLARMVRICSGNIVALGTIMSDTDASEGMDRGMANDLNPKFLSRAGRKAGVHVLTWDSLGVSHKADEFAYMDEQARRAMFQTTSCQMWWKIECGNCRSCKARHAAFLKAFGYDPTAYRNNSAVMRQ